MIGRTPQRLVTSDPPSTTRPAGVMGWNRRILGFCLVIFALELGVFLLIFPWLRSWESNWVPVHSPRFADVWMSRYFRGALSGLGLLNIYISAAEFVRQVRSLLGPHQNTQPANRKSEDN